MSQKMLCWYDGDPKTTLDTKIRRAAEYYLKKYGTKVTHCRTSFSALQNEMVVDDIHVEPWQYAPTNHFYLWSKQ